MKETKKAIGKNRNLSVRGRLIALITISITVLLLVIAVVVLMNFKQLIIVEMNQELFNATSQAAMHIESLQGNITTTAINIGSDERIQSQYVVESSVEQQFLAKNRIIELLRSYMTRTDYILGIDVIYENGNCYSTGNLAIGGIFETDTTGWVVNFLRSKNSCEFSPPITISIKGKRGISAIAFASRFNNYYRNVRGYATVVIYITPDYLLGNLRAGFDDTTKVCLTDKNGEILFELLPNGSTENFGYNAKTIISSGWNLEVWASAASIQERFKLLLFVVVISFVLAGGVVCAVSIFSVSRWTAPIYDLIKLTEQVSTGDLNIEIPVVKNDEIGELLLAFADMTRKLGVYIDRTLQEEKDRNALQLELQMAKINPHFIYNTLDSAIWLSRMNRNKDAAELCQAFVEILQDTLHTEGVDMMTTVEDEIRLVQLYEKVQKVRYGNRFDIFYNVNNEALPIEIPKMTLQPIIENALFHGILPNEDKQGAIILSAKCKAGAIEITICDNGIGITQEMLDKLNTKEYRGVKSQMHSIGLSNIRSRLDIIYADSYLFRCALVENGGTEFYLELPIRREEHRR